METLIVARGLWLLAATLASLHCGAQQEGKGVGTPQHAAKVAPRFELRLAHTEAAPGLTPAYVGRGAPIFIAGEPLVTIEDVIDAKVVKDDDAGGVQIRLDFRSSAARRLTAATEKHTGKPLAILIDDRVASAPILAGPLGASVVISGSFEEAEVAALVSEFQAVAKRNRSNGPLLCWAFRWC